MKKIIKNDLINKELYKDIITKSYNELVPCLVKNTYIYTINDRNFNLSKINSNSNNFKKPKMVVKQRKIWEEFTKQTNICKNKSLYPKNIDNLTYWKLHSDLENWKDKNPTVVKIISNLLFIYGLYYDEFKNYTYLRRDIYSIFWNGLVKIINKIIQENNIILNKQNLIKVINYLINKQQQLTNKTDINSLQKQKTENIYNNLIYKVISYDDMIKLFVNIKQWLNSVNNNGLILQNVLTSTIINKNIPYLWKELLIDIKNKEKTWYTLKNLVDNLYYKYTLKKLDKYLLNQDGRIEIVIWNKDWYEIKLFDLLIKENRLKKDYKSVNNVINDFVNTIIEWKTYKVVDKFFVSNYFINNLVFVLLKYLINTEIWEYLCEDYYILNIYTNKKQSYKNQLKDKKINKELIQTNESYFEYLDTNTHNEENKDKILNLNYLEKKINDNNTKLEEKYLYYYLIQYIKQKYKNKLKDYEFYFDLAKLEKINSYLDLYVNAWNVVKKIKLELKKQLLYNYWILSSLDALKLYVKKEKIVDIPVLYLDKFKIEDKIIYTDILKASKSILYQDGLDLPFIIIFTDFDTINKNKVNLHIFFVNKHNSINLVEFDELKLFTLWW